MIFLRAIACVSDYLWSFPMPLLIAFTGVWIGIRGRTFRELRPSAVVRNGLMKLDVGGFTALCTALAGTVGTGNIVGVAVALYFGGPGALLWMWISALAGMAVKYSEAFLSVKYGGGPMYYIKRGLGNAGMASAFAAVTSVAALAVGNASQVGAIAESALDLFGGGMKTRLICASAVSIFALISLKTGTRGRTLNFIVPFMAFFYLFGCVSVIIKHYSSLPGVFADILKGALRPEAVAWGFRRGIASNEAGVGSSPIAHAENKSASPRQEGTLGVIEVAFDTLLISTFTGLMLLAYGTGSSPALWPSRALSSVFGGSARFFTAISLCLFAFSSVLSWSFYGEKAFGFLLGEKKTAYYRAAFIIAAGASAFLSLESAVAVSDLLCAFMAIPNVSALIMLAPRIREGDPPKHRMGKKHLDNPLQPHGKETP